MPVPVWDCTDMSLLEEPLDSVLSDDIWKKFDLDEPLDAQYIYGHQGGSVSSINPNGVNNGLHGIEKPSLYSGLHGGGFSSCSNPTISTGEEIGTIQSLCQPETNEKVSCRESREIRHHDCMWAGLCISKEHNRTLPAKKDSLMNNKRVQAGRSLLISSRNSINNQQTVNHQTNNPNQQTINGNQQTTGSVVNRYNNRRRINKDGFESDGDSARPETPQSSESEIDDEEDDDDDENENDNDDEENDNEDDEEVDEKENNDCENDENDSERITSLKENRRSKTDIDDSVNPPFIFKHDQISINEKLSECMMPDEFGNVRSAPVSEVTGQLVRKFHQHQYPHHHHHHYHHHHHHHHQNRHHQLNHHSHVRNHCHNHHRNHHAPLSPPPSATPLYPRTNHNHNDDRTDQHHQRRNTNHDHQSRNDNGIKIENNDDHDFQYEDSNDERQRESNAKNEPDNWNTLNDHCYHQPSSKKLEHLGVQTPSDSEEEIDVVTFEKPCRPAALPTYPSIADQQHFQLTVKSALKEKPSGGGGGATTPRPRGRPPSSGTPRKRTATPSDSKPSKRPKHHRTYLSRSKVGKNDPPTPASSPFKTNTIVPSIVDTSQQPGNSRSSSSDDEPDTEKRSLHNNMERQRRIELRNAFEDLRLLVPEIENKEKAPKVAILRQAAIYCDMLTEIDRVTSARVVEMKRRQERLRARLSQLRRSLAMTR